MEEQTTILGADNVGQALDFDTVAKMDYLQDCVKESLRMFPPLILLMRMAMTDIETTLKGEWNGME